MFNTAIFFCDRYLVSQGVIKPLCDLLTVMDSKIVQVALSGLENILRVGKQDSFQTDGVNQFAVMVEEAYGECAGKTCYRVTVKFGFFCFVLLTSEHQKSNPATGGLLSVVGGKALRMIKHLWLIFNTDASLKGAAY